MNNDMNKTLRAGTAPWICEGYDPAAPILSCVNLNKSYIPARPVLHNLNISLTGGKIVGLLGPNGCGKSTLLKLISGILVPDSGTIEICGIPQSETTNSLVSFLPERTYGQTAEEMAAWMIGEIREGIDGTGVKAGMIGEIGTSKNTMTETERKVFDAAVIAARETGMPIYTHTTLGTYAPEQAQYFKDAGLDLSRIVLGHIDLSGDLDYIRRVLDYGITIGFDTVGKNNYFPDAKRVEFLLALENEGRMDQIVLSEDLTRKTHLEFKGGIGYSYLFDTFIPMVKAAGLKQESLDKMLIHNPARILGI